jgi:uncharacterized protein
MLNGKWHVTYYYFRTSMKNVTEKIYPEIVIIGVGENVTTMTPPVMHNLNQYNLYRL